MTLLRGLLLISLILWPATGPSASVPNNRPANVRISGNPLQFNVIVTQGADHVPKQILELQLRTRPSQVQLIFINDTQIRFVSNDGDLVEISVPREYAGDLIHIMENWRCTSFEFVYNPANNNNVLNFDLHSVSTNACARRR